MGMDCCRYIEVNAFDVKGILDKYNIAKIGQLKIGDIIMVYNTYKTDYSTYNKIVDINGKGEFVYEPIKLPDNDVNQYLDHINNLDIAFRVEYVKNMPLKNIKIKYGDTYIVWNNGQKQFYTYKGLLPDGSNNWEISDTCKKSWIPLKCNNNIFEYVTSGSNRFVTKYVRNIYDDITKKKFPDDISNEIMEELDGQFGYNWFTIDEIDNIVDIEFNKYNETLKEAYSNRKLDEISDKLDILLGNKSKDKSDDEYYDDSDEIIEEALYNYIDVFNEYKIMYALFDTLSEGYFFDEWRIIYALNN